MNKPIKQLFNYLIIKPAITAVFLGMCSVSFSSFATSNANTSFVLKNLERERAELLNVLTRNDLAFAERQLKAKALLQRLATVERIALNADTTENNQLAQQVFASYDMSFLLHASTEKNQTIIEHWLSELELSDHDIEQGWAGER